MSQLLSFCCCCKVSLLLLLLLIRFSSVLTLFMFVSFSLLLIIFSVCLFASVCNSFIKLKKGSSSMFSGKNSCEWYLANMSLKASSTLEASKVSFSCFLRVSFSKKDLNFFSEFSLAARFGYKFYFHFLK